MKSIGGVLGIVCALAVWGGCGASSPGDGDGDGDAMIVPDCATDDECLSASAPECTSNGICAGCTDGAACARFPETPLCLVGGGQCVACRDSGDCADPAAPTCDATAHTCRACSADADCGSGVCDIEEGTCVDASTIYLVDDDAPCAIGDGSAAAPFCSIAEALGAFAVAPRNFVAVLPGQYTFPLLVTAPLPSFVSVEQGGAVVGPAAVGDDCLAVSVNASILVRGFAFAGCDIAVRVDAVVSQIRLIALAIEGATTGIACRADRCVISGVRTTGGGVGVLCPGRPVCPVNDPPTTGGVVRPAPQGAPPLDGRREPPPPAPARLSLENSEVLVRGTTVTDVGLGSEGAAFGVGCGKSFCTLEGLTIRRTRGPGLFMAQSQFELRSSAILENGTTDGMAAAPNGGVVISNPGATPVFGRNTVFGHRAPAGAVAGVRCGLSTAIKSSIVWGNAGDSLDAACTATYSDIAGGAAGEGNIDADPQLLVSAPGAMDPHLVGASPCVDTGDPAGGAAFDLDGEARPRGVRLDMGADER